jgi:hypothetical protein
MMSIQKNKHLQKDIIDFGIVSVVTDGHSKKQAFQKDIIDFGILSVVTDGHSEKQAFTKRYH